MLQGNYEQILKLISQSSGLSRDELERKIEGKRAKLSGLISKEGAAQIVASELGINFEKQKMKISELLTGMKKINVSGKIIKMNRVVEYNKNGRSGKIGSFTIADETANIRIVLWDVNHIALIERGELKEGDVVEISGADVRNSEIHLTSFADIKKSGIIIENVQTKQVFNKKTISEIGFNESVDVRAFVVQIFGPTFFNVCPECGKKVSESGECEKHGKVDAQRRAILTFIIDDGTENIRAVLFSDQIKKIASDSDLESSDSFMPKREELIGKEFLIQASSRRNKLSGSMELFVGDIQEIELDKLIEELEKKQ
jgi:ssDNA-binding replication factor A large subunit